MRCRRGDNSQVRSVTTCEIGCGSSYSDYWRLSSILLSSSWSGLRRTRLGRFPWISDEKLLFIRNGNWNISIVWVLWKQVDFPSRVHLFLNWKPMRLAFCALVPRCGFPAALWLYKPRTFVVQCACAQDTFKVVRNIYSFVLVNAVWAL